MNEHLFRCGCAVAWDRSGVTRFHQEATCGYCWALGRYDWKWSTRTRRTLREHGFALRRRKLVALS